MTLLAIVLLVAFIGLGRWQWQRGVAKQQLWDQFAHAPVPEYATHPPNFDSLPRFERVAFPARYEPSHQFLLDNRLPRSTARCLRSGWRSRQPFGARG